MKREEIFHKYSERQEELRSEGKRIKGPLVLTAKIGMNELCPCNSGKKYKKCCGN